MRPSSTNPSWASFFRSLRMKSEEKNERDIAAIFFELEQSATRKDKNIEDIAVELRDQIEQQEGRVNRIRETLKGQRARIIDVLEELRKEDLTSDTYRGVLKACIELQKSSIALIEGEEKLGIPDTCKNLTQGIEIEIQKTVEYLKQAKATLSDLQGALKLIEA